MNKCMGCGVTLVYDDEKLPGFTPSKENNLCQRCFNIKNYNKVQGNEIKLEDENILSKINELNHFTFFLVDIFSLNDKTINLYNKINNDKILIITKGDIFPLNIKKEHIIENIKKIYDVKDALISSTITKDGYSKITSLIKRKKEVIFAGPTSSGKSSLINGLIASDITVSYHKNTTLDFIELNVEDCIIYDSPGFSSSQKENKQKGAVRPKTICLKKDYILEIDKYKLYFNEETNLTLFLNTNVSFKTKKKTKDLENVLNIDKKSDIVLSNFGFIYLKKGKCYINDLEDVFVRTSIVGGK